MDGLTIRPATPDDVPAIVAFGRELVGEMPYAVPCVDADLAIYYSGIVEKGVILIAEVEGRIIGGIGLRETPLFWNLSEFTTQVKFIYIAESFRGRMANLFMARVMSMLKGRRVELTVNSGGRIDAKARWFRRFGLAVAGHHFAKDI